jgi:hypothetical protein
LAEASVTERALLVDATGNVELLEVFCGTGDEAAG